MRNCGNCGAPTLPDEVTGALVCGHCGSIEQQPALVRHIAVVGESSLPCPACGAALAEGRLDGLPLQYCRRCQGMLVEMERFVAVIDAAIAYENQTGVPLPRRQNPGDRVLACPACGRPMDSHLYAGPGNLVIDICERCHVNWLDSGELRRIARAPRGRMDR